MPTVICMADHIYDETEPEAVRRDRGDIWEASQEFVDAIAARDEAAKNPPMLQVLNMPETKPQYGGMNPGPGRGRKRKVTYEDQGTASLPPNVEASIPPLVDTDTAHDTEVEDDEDR